MNQEVELIAGTIRGSLPGQNLPSPRLIKIFIAGERDEFTEERKQLLEVVGPELQSLYDDMGIEVLLVDMEYGTKNPPEKNPRLAEFYLEEIRASHKHSRGAFLLILAGFEYNTGWIPTKISVEAFQLLKERSSVLEEHYEQQNEYYVLKATEVETASEIWQELVEPLLREALKSAAEEIVQENQENEEIRNILKSTPHRQLEFGLSLDQSGSGIVSVTRHWENAPTSAPKYIHRMQALINLLPASNQVKFSLEFSANGVNPTKEAHENYLNEMKHGVLEIIQTLVNRSVEEDPEIKSRKKMVQEIYAESLLHLSILREIPPANEEDEVVQRIRQQVINGSSNKHDPIFLHGARFTSKTSFLSRIHRSCGTWLPDRPLSFVYRACASSSRSAYALELLRVLCQQLSFLIGSSDGTPPRDASFDPLYLKNWFGKILREIEEGPREMELLVMLDDLDRLQPLGSDIVTPLSWLPVQLPPGIHLILTSSHPPEMLPLTPYQKDRLRSDEVLIKLPRNEHVSVEDQFDALDELIGPTAAQKIAAILASSEFGLSETEILEATMPTGGEGPLELERGLFNFATWCLVRRSFQSCIQARVISGRLVFAWRRAHRDAARRRHLCEQETVKAIHAETAQLFFPNEDEENSEENTEDSEKTQKLENQEKFNEAQEKQEKTKEKLEKCEKQERTKEKLERPGKYEKQEKMKEKLKKFEIKEKYEECEKCEEDMKCEECEEKEKSDNKYDEQSDKSAKDGETKREGERYEKKLDADEEKSAEDGDETTTREQRENENMRRKQQEDNKNKTGKYASKAEAFEMESEKREDKNERKLERYERKLGKSESLEHAVVQSRAATPTAQERPFKSRPRAQDLTYTLRHVEEAWLHLLRAADAERFKRLTVCAFDFLLAAVQMISVSYLRCVLEHARIYLLERDLELVYYAVRNSSDVLTKDPLQLGAQLICWLRPVAEDGGDLVSRMVTSAMAWCDGYTLPLLVPLNSWLPSPLPLKIRALACPQPIRLIEVAPSGQHVIVVPPKGDPQLWHVMSVQLIHTFRGHSGPITCLSVTQQSQYLVTGSEDTTIIVWDLKELELTLRIHEHIAPILCLALARKNSLILSSGEDSRIIAMSLLTGEVLIRIDHHRGPVTSIKSDASGEILVSGSVDKTVCVWCLETFTLLNSIVLPSAVTQLDVSSDSVFLLVGCEDQKLYLRSLATGTEIHTLRGHQGPVRSFCLAKDCRRAVAGGAEGRVSVFDMHSGRLIGNLPASNNADVTCVKVTDKDDFLITACGDKVTYWSFRGEDSPRKSQKGGKQETQQPHSAPITCLDISRDGAMVVTGGDDSLVNLWQLNTHELQSTYEGHIASVTCVAFSPSGLFVASGSEDKTVRVWGLTLGLVVATFRHQAPVTAVTAMLDGRRIVSSDRSSAIRVWAADTGTLIQSVYAPGRCLAVTSDMRYAICGSGDNQVRIVSLGPGPEEKHTVTHSQPITCLVATPDSQALITGSRDMSLKVWQLAGGKLSQVLVGHTDHVTCVAVSVLDKCIVVSGSRDASLIVWDIQTGVDVHTLKSHLGCVTCVRLSADGSIAASGSEDKSLIVWDTRKGSPLSSIKLHLPIVGLEMASDCSRLALHLLEFKHMPILCLHNTHAQYVKLPTYVAPRDIRGPTGPKRPVRRLLKKEISLDTYTWQRKYGHLTSGIMISTVEERLKRRFSVSASMEEISKAGQSLANQEQQAALAQSQHFDQLEAIWNKQSPPPRARPPARTLSKQSSLQAMTISDSEEEDVPE